MTYMYNRLFVIVLGIFFILIKPSFGEGNSQSTQKSDYNSKKERSLDDPTVIDTRLGFSSSGGTKGSRGSLGLDDIRKINYSYDEDDNWSLGGSWLFKKIGIVNFRGSKGDDRTSYSVGTYIRLNDILHKDTGKWLIFPAAGYNYTTFDSDYLSDSQGYYIGVFALRPITKKINIGLFSFATRGTDNYEKYESGIGTSYGITKYDRINCHYSYTDQSYKDSEGEFAIGYIHKFH